MPEQRVSGFFFLFPAYLIWGLSPVFWKSLSHVASFELLLHRTIWSFLFLTVIVLSQGRGHEIREIFSSSGSVVKLAGTAMILGLNWYLFIWAVNHDQVLQTSLGYYINPLLMVLLGMLFFKERLRKLQIAALLIAAGAVTYYAVSLGRFPWIALAIAFTFGIYGLVHKMTRVDALPGLLVETLMMSVPSAAYLAFLFSGGEGAVFRIGFTTDLLLSGTCLVTALPLLLFTTGARRSPLTTVGFMQYIAPSCSFLLAVFVYREPFSVDKLLTFICIWTALSLYTADSIFYHSRRFSRAGNFRIKNRVITGIKEVKNKTGSRP
ncbi:MAG: EamA family transporter RarD [Desulfobacteraceae bacterium]